ncbi:MAG: phosphate/phosphite/phosphonate ABC transporter substrate-binding protein [Cellvibrionaceae bacterium]
MIDDPNSLSGYQIPKAAIKKYNLDEDLFTTNYYRSHQRLQQALQLHEVDVIATYSELNVSDGKLLNRLILAENLPGIHWFFTAAKDDQMMMCEVKIEVEKYLSGLQTPLKVLKLPELVCSYGH